MVTTGTHYGLVSIGINNRMTIGYDTIAQPGALASNVAQGGVGSFFLGILGARNFAGASPGLLTIAAYIGEDTLKYFYTAIAGLVISVVVSLIVTFVLYKED